jgi:hypothetical protein
MRPQTIKPPTPPPAQPSMDQNLIDEQARMLKEYEDKQNNLVAAREAEERRRADAEAAQRAEFERRQAEQAERERLAQEQLMQQQMMQYNNQAANQLHELERELLAMRGQYERDQLMLEQYDRVRLPASGGAAAGADARGSGSARSRARWRAWGRSSSSR